MLYNNVFLKFLDLVKFLYITDYSDLLLKYLSHKCSIWKTIEFNKSMHIQQKLGPIPYKPIMVAIFAISR